MAANDIDAQSNRPWLFDLNLDTIWDTASASLPELICIVKPIFDELAASHAIETRAKDQ